MSYSCKTFFCPDSYRDNSDYGFLCACVLAKVSGIFNFSDVPFDVPFLIGRAQCNPGIALRGLTSPLALSKVEGDLLSAGRQLISLHAKTCNVLRRKIFFVDNSDYIFSCASVLARVLGVYNFSDVPLDVPFGTEHIFCIALKPAYLV